MPPSAAGDECHEVAVAPPAYGDRGGVRWLGRRIDARGGLLAARQRVVAPAPLHDETDPRPPGRRAVRLPLVATNDARSRGRAVESQWDDPGAGPVRRQAG